LHGYGERYGRTKLDRRMTEKIYELPTAGTHEIELVSLKDKGEKQLLTFLVLDQRGTDGKYVCLFVWANSARLKKLAAEIGVPDISRALKAKMLGSIVHAERDGKTYANLAGIVKDSVRLAESSGGTDLDKAASFKCPACGANFRLEQTNGIF
jgi:hypothetical protein